MSKDDLLDQLIADTQADLEAPIRPPEKAPIDPRLQEPPAETSPKRWAHDPNVKADIAGIRTGHRFEMTECGEDLDGTWVVVKLDLNHPDPNQRFLVAERPEGGPPYMKMSELDFLDEIHVGRVSIT